MEYDERVNLERLKWDKEGDGIMCGKVVIMGYNLLLQIE